MSGDSPMTAMNLGGLPHSKTLKNPFYPARLRDFSAAAKYPRTHKLLIP